MKSIFSVGSAIVIAIMVLSQEMALAQQEETMNTCPPPRVCGKREDGFCQAFKNTCQLDNVNCQVHNISSRRWTVVNNRECSNISNTNTIGLCSSGCPVTENCNSTPADHVCAADNNSARCTMYTNLCALKKDICNNPSKRGLFRAVNRRCVQAGIVRPGETGTCAPK